MKIKWSDYVSNVEVLRRAGLDSVEAVLTTMQLRWTGHVIRMEDHRIPKQLLYGELAEGKRKVGGQKLRYKDVQKRHLKSMNIDVNSWEQLAEDRNSWRRSLHAGKEVVQRKIRAASDLLHYRRHNPGTVPCPDCDKSFHTERGLLQHHRMKHRNLS